MKKYLITVLKSSQDKNMQWRLVLKMEISIKNVKVIFYVILTMLFKIIIILLCDATHKTLQLLDGKFFSKMRIF